MRFTVSPRPIIRTTALALLGLCVALGAVSCSRYPNERVPKTKWIVMEFAQPETMRTNPREIRGWWFGARTIRQDERAGATFATLLGDELAQLDFVNVVSAIDLKYYFAGKLELLEKKYGSGAEEGSPKLEREELRALMRKVPQIDYAREIGVDKMLTGRIVRQSLTENRTIHWWWSVTELEVQVVDVPTGKVEWSRHYKERGQLDSTQTIQMDLARRIVEDLKQQYFRKMVKG